MTLLDTILRLTQEGKGIEFMGYPDFGVIHVFLRDTQAGVRKDVTFELLDQQVEQGQLSKEKLLVELINILEMKLLILNPK